MSFTQTALRQAVGWRLGELTVLPLITYDSGTPTIITAPALIDSVEDDSRYAGGWFYCSLAAIPVVQTSRRIASYESTTGVLTLSRSIAPGPASGVFEVHTLLDPLIMNRLINDGLERLTYLTSDTITPVDGAWNYDLSSFTWLTHPDQVVDVQYLIGTDPDIQVYPARWFNVEERDGAIYLDVRPVSASGEILLTAWRHYDRLTSDSGTSTCPLDWATVAGCVEVMRYMESTAPGSDVTRWDARLNQAETDQERLSRKYVPRRTRRVMQPWASQTRYRSDIVS